MSIRFHQKLLILAISIIFIGIPSGLASADIGPKPTFEFIFSFSHDQALSVVNAELLECIDLDCAATATLQVNHTSSMNCEDEQCTGSLFFGRSPAYRLKVQFSDNQTRISNPFTISMMRNVYNVKVQDKFLVVSKNYIKSNNVSGAIMLCLVPYTAVGILILLGGIFTSNLLLLKKNQGSQLKFTEAKANYLFAWILSGIALVGGAFLSWALPLTILIELAAAYLYWRYLWLAIGTMKSSDANTANLYRHTKENRPAWLPLMTAVIAVNLITQPFFWVIATTFSGYLASGVSWLIILLEIIVWLVEAVLLRILQRGKFNWGDAFLLSFIMNACSFLIGLLFTF